MSARISIALVALGCVLVGFSFAVPSLLGGRNAWTDNEAADLADAQTMVHALRGEAAADFQKRHGDSSTASQQIAARLEAAETRYKHLNANLDAARTKGQSTALILRWSGAAVAVLGFVLLAASRPRRADDDRPRGS
jgi:hypothetical protein